MFAGYVVLQYVVLASAWNILGGYAGYVNFGSAAFFAIGAYGTVVLDKLLEPPLVVAILFGGIVAGLVGLVTGYLTLRLRGAFFAIATLALAIVLQTLVTNWEFVGGPLGFYTIRPNSIAGFPSYVNYLFAVMLVLALISVLVARAIALSFVGRGLAAIRDNELAAECCGVPTLRLKVLATMVSGGLMGIGRGALPLLHHLPRSKFRLQHCVWHQQHRHASHRRHVPLDRSGDRRRPPRSSATGRDGHPLLGTQPHDRRRTSDQLHNACAERHRRPVRELSAAKASAPQHMTTPKSLSRRFQFASASAASSLSMPSTLQFDRESGLG